MDKVDNDRAILSLSVKQHLRSLWSNEFKMEKQVGTISGDGGMENVIVLVKLSN